MSATPIRASNRTGVWVMWVFTLIWCAVSAPLLWQVVERWGGPDETSGVMLALLFPAVGVILIGVSATATWSLLRFGPAPLQPVIEARTYTRPRTHERIGTHDNAA